MKSASVKQLTAEAACVERLLKIAQEIGDVALAEEYRQQLEYGARLLAERDGKRVRKD
ncbi:MAG TPA: hypothetical protein VJJ27_01080 [Candidatus Paceibacterota bacterium]